MDRLMERVRAGHSQVLVVRGEAGIGKTALLEYLLEGTSGCQVARAVGVESEMELPFAGLHQLCAPFLDRLERLPGPQRDSLRTAFGLDAGQPPDGFIVGVAVLGLLSEMAGDGPLVCVIDDLQWQDRASARTFAFVARRLPAESVALVLAVREPSEGQELAGLPELPVRGLSRSDAGTLLDSLIPGRLDERVRERILAETRGNPLALLALPGASTAAELAGGFAPPDVTPRANRIEQSFQRRLEALPTQTQRLLLTAAAEPIGDVTVLWRAAERLGLGADAAAAAQRAGWIELGARVRFCHPLMRSAVYRSASSEEKQDVHCALAEVTDPARDPDGAAWHRAHAAVGPDEVVAATLQRSATRAQRRGGIAAAAAFLERATELTPDPVRRAARALDAAHAKLQAGAFEPALALLAAAETGPLDDPRRARIDLLRARIACASSGGSEAAPLLLAAADRLEQLDVGLARETYLDAFSAAMFAGRLARGTGLPEVARAARRVATPSHQQRSGDLLLHALTLPFRDGCAAVPIGRRALEVFQSEDISVDKGMRFSWLASAAAADMWDDERWHVVSARHVKVAREAGALSELPLALNSHALANMFAGELATAASLVEEAQAVTEATGARLAPYGALGLAAWCGREAAADALIETTMSEVMPRGEGLGVTVAQWASALLANGRGRYDDALIAARQASEHPHELAVGNWALTELIEAAARSGRTELAADAVERLSDMTRASGSDWALGIQARSRALLDEGPETDALYREAVERLGRTRVRAELARARLLYGEWLRRERRSLQARGQLRNAYDTFTAIGAEAFADRARRELQATGETVRKRTPETRDALTPQESQIARLAAERQTNPEIGARLFISPRTVEYHLRKVFTKLDISSRKELRHALAGNSRPDDRPMTIPRGAIGQ
jgi:DNA-binding CsgD family transcriptional regulator/tetratricopeptide (TPR) repeat protein